MALLVLVLFKKSPCLKCPEIGTILTVPSLTVSIQQKRPGGFQSLSPLSAFIFFRETLIEYTRILACCTQILEKRDENIFISP